MNRKTVSGMMVTLLLVGTLAMAFSIQPVKAIHTIYIRPDGSIDPSSAPIHREGDLYTLTDNIFSDTDGIVIERNNMMLDGTGHTLHGTGSGSGIDVSGRSNVTVKNMEVKEYTYGIFFRGSSNNIVSENNITANIAAMFVIFSSNNNTISSNNMVNNSVYTIAVGYCHGNSIRGNNIANNNGIAIVITLSGFNSIVGNIITNNENGIVLGSCHDNIIYENIITNNDYGIQCGQAGNNSIYHNNFINNTDQAYIYEAFDNTWDDGYPSGGNYWSDYEEKYPSATEIDDSGLWDTPYVIDADNQDYYPLMEPWTPSPPIPTTIDELKTEIEELGSEGEIDNQGIVKSLIAKLNVAQKLADKGKTDQAKNLLNAFINEVQAQSGKHMTSEAADVLIESAEYILSHL